MPSLRQNLLQERHAIALFLRRHQEEGSDACVFFFAAASFFLFLES
jgi:hypothetical protein